MLFRLATLALALAAAGSAVAQSDPTTVDAQKIEGVGDLEVSARGSAEIQHGEITVFGEFLRYNREFGELEAQGGVRLQSGVDRFFGPSLQYNTLDDTGVLESPGFLLQRERPARGSAERMEMLGRNTYRLINARFTTCQPGQDDWFLEAERLDLDYNNYEGKASHPRLRFFDQTLLTFPYAGFPLENRRRSGLLTPYYSQTSTRGLEFGIPYYWNIAPERDATLTPVFMTRRGFQLKSHFRYMERPYTGELGSGAFSAQFRLQRFQTLQDPLAPIVPPYHRLPQLNAAATHTDIGGIFDSTLPGEFVRFTHPLLVEGSRASFSPSLAAPHISPGWYVTPKVGLRYAGYQLDRQAEGEPQRPTYSVPWFSFDSGLSFERSTLWSAQSLTQTLEPRLFYVLVPYHNQDHIPLFDTTLADFNYPQLFTENRFVGGDRFGDANQMTFAATTRFLQTDGQEMFRATLGERFYFRDERVALTPGATQRTAHESDILASIGGRAGRASTFDATTQYNPTNHRIERYGLAMRYAPEVAKVFNASYRYQRDLLRQIDLSAQWPVTAG